MKKQVHKNKAVIKDMATGLNWWATAKGKVYPTNWRLQGLMYNQQAEQKVIQDKLYGKPK